MQKASHTRQRHNGRLKALGRSMEQSVVGKTNNRTQMKGELTMQNELDNQTYLFEVDNIPPEIAKLRNHGAPLSTQDLKDFSKSQYKVYQLMRDQLWHSATEIIEASGLRSGLRVMRTFRDKGWQVNKQKSKEYSREWMYQLVK